MFLGESERCVIFCFTLYAVGISKMVKFPRIVMDTITNEVRTMSSLVAGNHPKNLSEGNGRRRASQSAANVSRAVYTIRGRFQVEEREKEEPGLSGPSFREESGEKARRNKGVESLEANRPPPPASLDSTGVYVVQGTRVYKCQEHVSPWCSRTRALL